MKLSGNFQLSEFEKSATADRLGLINTPNEEQVENLRNLVHFVLQPIRDSFSLPVKVHSGFRSKDLNKIVGGSRSSSHIKGEAADIEIYGVDNFELARWIKNSLRFDQLILEFYQDGEKNSGWIHVSYRKAKNRQEILTSSREEESIKYHKGLVIF